MEAGASGFAPLLQPDAPPAGQAAETAAPAAAAPAAAADIAAGTSSAAAAVRDRDASRHGDATLRALALAQADLLGGTPGAARQALAALAHAPPDASDPGLAALLRAIAVRSAVERARGD